MSTERELLTEVVELLGGVNIRTTQGRLKAEDLCVKINRFLKKPKDDVRVAEVRLWLTRDKYSLLDVMNVQNNMGKLCVHCRRPNE